MCRILVYRQEEQIVDKFAFLCCATYNKIQVCAQITQCALTKWAFNCTNLTIKTLEQGVKYVQS